MGLMSYHVACCQALTPSICSQRYVSQRRPILTHHACFRRT